MIHVPNVRETVDWYQQIGFEIRATSGDGTGENFSFAIVKFGETEVMFNQLTFRPVAIASAAVIFKVEDGKTIGLTLVQDGHRLELSHVTH